MLTRPNEQSPTAAHKAHSCCPGKSRQVTTQLFCRTTATPQHCHPTWGPQQFVLIHLGGFPGSQTCLHLAEISVQGITETWHLAFFKICKVPAHLQHAGLAQRCLDALWDGDVLSRDAGLPMPCPLCGFLVRPWLDHSSPSLAPRYPEGPSS